MRLNIKVDLVNGQKYMAVSQKGKPLLLNPLTNKGTAFTVRERDELNLHGLLPATCSNMKQQLERTYENFCAEPNDIEKHIYLTSLHDRNETLFYRLLFEHIDEMMPVVYTPVVGEACQRFSHIFQRSRGIYVTYEHREMIDRVLTNAGIENPSVIVVTDGERILGLGDQGAGGMGIAIGKLCLYTLCAGVSPFSTLPILLDVGTDNTKLLDDPLYLGLRRPRVRGEPYQAFIDAFVHAVNKVFPHVVLQWEDFLKANAIRQLHRFRDKLCTFNDDIQGTASVVIAGLYCALRITKRPLRDQKVVFAGAGASAQGISDLLVSAFIEEGLSRKEAIDRIWMVDSMGLVTRLRPNLEDFKAAYARPEEEVANYKCRDQSHIGLEEAVESVRPTILIGTSGRPRLFTESLIKLMAHINERPIIFPLSNPTSKSECTAEEAIRWSEGRVVIATGSPFAPVTYNGKRYRIGQGNNAFIFPGVGLGLAVSRARRVTYGMFLEAAKALASEVTVGNLEENAVYPELSRIRECSRSVACRTVEQAVNEDCADEECLEDLEESIDRAMWFPKYLPMRYEP